MAVAGPAWPQRLWLSEKMSPQAATLRLVVRIIDSFLVAAGDDLEQGGGVLCGHGQIAQLVDYEHCRTGEEPHAVCVYAALIETLINHALAAADVRDPDLGDQLPHRRPSPARPQPHPPPPTHHQRARRIHLTTRRSPLQARTLTAIGADTHTWDKATIT